MSGGLRAITAAAVLMLTACASRSPILPQLVPQATAPVELSDTVFFPQSEFQCGPAALATVLHSAGVVTKPDALAEQVFMPARQGSLQVELLAATRRAGRIPYQIDPTLRALRAELDAGRPVLVLQNLGLGMLPVWHYAVAIGLDPVGDRVVLRSGVERRQLSPASGFLRTWGLADGWAMVVLRPGELPAGADRARYLRAVAQAERFLSSGARRDAYRAALVRWPNDATAQFGAAFALHAGGDLQGAEDAYRGLIGRHPRHAAAHNNLAEVLSARGCHAQARRAAIRALELARSDYPGLVEAIHQTLQGLPAQADTLSCAAAGR